MRMRIVCLAAILAMTAAGCGSAPQEDASGTVTQAESAVAEAGSAGSTSAAEGSSAGESENSAPEQPDPAEQADAGAETGSQNTGDEESASSAEKAGETGDFAQVLADDDNIRFEITGTETDPIWGYTWKVTAENKSDRTIMFSIDDVSVNDVMCDPLFAVEVAPGKKANTDISWALEQLEEKGIDEVTKVEFELKAYDSEDFMTDYFEEMFTVYPKGEEAAKNSSREAQESDRVLFDTEQCAMSITKVDPEGDWGYTIHVHLENKMDVPLMFAADEVSVNGIMCDPFWATEVQGGKTSESELSWSSSQFEENGIEKVETIELPIRVSNSEDFMADPVFEKTFTLQT